MNTQLTHFDAAGNAVMVDVSGKAVTAREATAHGCITMNEAAFAAVEPDGSVTLRYFTPAGEVELCGHATIATFALLRALGRIGDGTVTAHTKAAQLAIEVQGDTVVVDFNRAFSPPCAFTDFAVCPLPVRQNIMPFAIRAGEKKPAGH